MPNIKLKLKDKQDISYNLLIERDCINKLPKYLKKAKLGNKYAVITDSKVKKLFGLSLIRFLKNNGIEAELFSFTQGEKSKSLTSVESISNEMIAKKIDRKDAIIALGGGVVGDLAGLIASVYMRGIPYIHVPTTLLAMVDSSIGGKTGVDLVSGKNLIGTINHPKAVFMDTKYIDNLPQTQIRSGLGEIIKYGVIKNLNLFEFIEQNLQKILDLDQKAIMHIIVESVKIKTKVVEKDEKEAGLRMILNYGHTYGHAIERKSGYKLLHGYAISIGMVIANKIAVDNKLLKKEDADRIKKLIKDAGLPVTTVKKPSKQDLMCDKKRIGDYINFILPTKIGQVVIHKEKCQ